MILFKEKQYAVQGKAASKTWETIKEAGIKNVLLNPFGWIGAAGSAAGIANYMSQKKRLQQADLQHQQVMKQNDRLIRALSGVERGLSNIPQQQPQIPVQQKDDSWLKVGGKDSTLKIGGRKIFSEKKEKTYGAVTESMASGATTGAAIGTLAVPLSMLSKNKIGYAGPLIGAALGGLIGAGYGIAKTINQKTSQMSSGHSLIKEVVKNLERSNLKRGKDWTMDPKESSFMKTKVCVVISTGDASELSILVNTVSDPKLKHVSDEVLRNLPGKARKTEKISDRFNDIQISSIPGEKDAVYISSIIEGFIKRGFPVYLMEVG